MNDKVNSEAIPYNPNQIEPQIIDPHTIGRISAATRVFETVPVNTREIIDRAAAKTALEQIKKQRSG